LGLEYKLSPHRNSHFYTNGPALYSGTEVVLVSSGFSRRLT